ncbi:MAG: (2Fe-2S)-binding protein [Acidimicrobiia bacterium]
MWVCLCKGVNDRQIRAVITAGARTPEEIALRCRATTGCGGCLPEVCRLLDDCLAALSYRSSTKCEPAGVGSR